MAFKLTKTELIQREKIAAALKTTGTALSEAVTIFNTTCEEAWKTVEAAQESYNEQVQMAQEFMVEVHDSHQNEFDEKSEKWQESDAGQAASGWLDEWEMDLDEEQLERPDPLGDPDLEAKTTFEQLPDGV